MRAIFPHPSHVPYHGRKAPHVALVADMIVWATENHFMFRIRLLLQFSLPVRLGGVLLTVLLLAGASMLAGASATPASGRETERHAIAMYGEPDLPAGFAHLPYADPAARKGGRIVFALQGTFDSLNALIVKGTAPDAVQKYVLQSLLYRSADEPFTSYGLLAKSVELPDDRRKVTFHLNERARFSDGRPVTADDVRFSFELLKAKGKPFHRRALAGVSGVMLDAPSTITFLLGDGTNRELPLIIGAIPIFARHATDADSFDQTSFVAPLGSGPYLVSEVKPGESVTLTRRSDFWAEDLPVMRGLFNAGEIRYDFYRDSNSLFEAFKVGLYDIRIESDPTRWSTGYDVPAVRDGRIHLETLTFQAPKGMTGLVFNTRRAVFADIRVREALALMFDFDWVNRNLFYGRYRRADSFFADSQLSAQGRPASARERSLLAPFADAVRPDVMAGTWAPPASDGSGRDRELARRALDLLAEAGYAISEGRLRGKADARPLTFEITVASRQQERLALNYAKALGRIGVEVTIRLIDDAQYWRRLSTFDYDMIQWNWPGTPSPGNEQIGRWGSAAAASQGAANYAGVRSPAADALMASMLGARAAEDFVAAVRALDRVLLSGSYIVPLYYLPETWVARSRDLHIPPRIPRFFLANEALWRSTDQPQEN